MNTRSGSLRNPFRVPPGELWTKDGNAIRPSGLTEGLPGRAFTARGGTVRPSGRATTDDPAWTTTGTVIRPR